jgi:hypothetical protein
MEGAMMADGDMLGGSAAMSRVEEMRGAVNAAVTAGEYSVTVEIGCDRGSWC